MIWFILSFFWVSVLVLFHFPGWYRPHTISSTYRLSSSHTSLFLHFFPPVPSVCWFTLSFPDYFHSSFLATRPPQQHNNSFLPPLQECKSSSYRDIMPPSHHNISCTRLTLCCYAPVSPRVLLSRSCFTPYPVVHLFSVSVRGLIGS